MDLLSVDVEGHEQEVFASLGEAIQAPHNNCGNRQVRPFGTA